MNVRLPESQTVWQKWLWKVQRQRYNSQHKSVTTPRHLRTRMYNHTEHSVSVFVVTHQLHTPAWHSYSKAHTFTIFTHALCSHTDCTIQTLLSLTRLHTWHDVPESRNQTTNNDDNSLHTGSDECKQKRSVYVPRACPLLNQHIALIASGYRRDITLSLSSPFFSFSSSFYPLLPTHIFIPKSAVFSLHLS